MKTNLSTKLHTATWIVAGILALVPLFSGKPLEQFVGTIIATVFWMAVYYLFFNYMTPSLLLSKKFIPFFGISLVTLLLLPFIGYTLLFISKGMFEGTLSNLFDTYSVEMHLSGFKALVLAGLFGSLFRLIDEYLGVPAK